MALAAAALLSLALAGVDGTAVDVQTSGRTESSALAFAPGAAAIHGLAAVDVLPKIALLLDHEHALRLTLAYEPQLRMSQSLSYAGGDTTLVHGGSARAEWDADPLWTLTGAARSSVRILDFLATGAGDLARLVDLRRAPPVFRFREDAASFGAEGRPTRLLTLTATASAASSGGVGADGSAAVPGMREAHLALGAARAQTDKDVLRLGVAGAAAAFDLGGAASFATATAGWTRQATRVLRLRLVAAASAVQDGPGGGRVVPGGEAGLDATPAPFGMPLTVSATFAAGPAFDRFLARVDERVGVDASATWALTKRWSVGAGGAWAHLAGAFGYTAARADLRAEWKASPRVALYADLWREQHRDPLAVADGTASYLGTSVGVVLAPVPP